MRKKITLGISLSMALILSGCGSDIDASQEIVEAATTEETDVFKRLNNEGSYTWTEDPSIPIVQTTVLDIYFGGGCAVWVYPSYADAKAENDANRFDFYDGEVWYGEDSLSTQGIILLTEDEQSACGKVVFSVFNWTIDKEETPSPVDSSSMEGKWGSDSWMYDNVGAFLIVKSLGGSDYSGIFYTQGQSGGVYKDSQIYLTDIGDGLAEVEWPSGNVTTATWGKPTNPNSSDSWKGDIWFDCLGELDFASSRADCNFFFAD